MRESRLSGSEGGAIHQSSLPLTCAPRDTGQTVFLAGPAASRSWSRTGATNWQMAKATARIVVANVIDERIFISNQTTLSGVITPLPLKRKPSNNPSAI